MVSQCFHGSGMKLGVGWGGGRVETLGKGNSVRVRSERKKTPATNQGVKAA